MSRVERVALARALRAVADYLEATDDAPSTSPPPLAPSPPPRPDPPVETKPELPPLVPWDKAGEMIAGGNGPKRTKMAQMIASGQIESVKIGRRRYVPRAAVEDYVRQLTEIKDH